MIQPGAGLEACAAARFSRFASRTASEQTKKEITSTTMICQILPPEG